MREEDRMAHLEKIEAVAGAIGLQHRREHIRSLTVIKIFDENAKEWILFDPVNQGKDVSKMMYHFAKSVEGYTSNELTFRTELLDWLLQIIEEEKNGQDNTVS